MKKLKILSLVLMLMVGVMCFSACDFNMKKTYTYEILSNSMAPAIELGDKVKVQAKDSYQTGDIIAFSYENMTVIHRIVFIISEENETYYICHGDNVQNVDGSISPLGGWEDDTAYIQGLVDYGATKDVIAVECYNIQFVTADKVVGAVCEVIKK